MSILRPFSSTDHFVSPSLEAITVIRSHLVSLASISLTEVSRGPHFPELSSVLAEEERGRWPRNGPRMVAWSSAWLTRSRSQGQTLGRRGQGEMFTLGLTLCPNCQALRQTIGIL